MSRTQRARFGFGLCRYMVMAGFIGLLLPATALRAQIPDGFEHFIDARTNVAVSLPTGLISESKETKYGKNWTSHSPSFQVDTLDFTGRSLAELYDKLSNRSGRVLTRNERSESGFVLAGHDSDGSLFHIEIGARDGRTVGLSLVYAREAEEDDPEIFTALIRGYSLFQAAEVPTAQSANSTPIQFAAMSCEDAQPLLQSVANTVRVEYETVGKVAAGEPVRIKWRNPAGPPPTSVPLYLVFTMPEYVRFTGPHIFPIPPGGRLPGGFSQGDGKLSAIIYLSGVKAPSEGIFTVRFYHSGSQKIEAAVLTAGPECGEVVFARPGTVGLDVRPSSPAVGAQDFFSTAEPKSVVISNDGIYRLEKYGSSYKVFETKTGIKIVDRAGVGANFSPAARFVAAYISGAATTGGSIELVDLFSGRPVPNLNLQGPTLAWALRDGLLIEGTQGHPEMHVRRTLVDPQFESADAGDPATETGYVTTFASGRGSSAWGRFRTNLALDEGIFVIENDVGEDGEASIASIQAFKISSGEQIYEGKPDVPWPETDDPAWWSEATARLYASFKNHFPRIPLRLGRGVKWGFGEPLTVSHYSPSSDEDAKAYLVAHRVPATGEQVIAQAGDVDAASWRARGVVRDLSVRQGATVAFAEQLAQYGVCITKGCFEAKASRRMLPVNLVKSSSFLGLSFQYGSQQSEFSVDPKQIEAELKQEIPLSKRILKTEPNRVCYQEDIENQDLPPEDNLKFRIIADSDGKTDVHGVWRWSIGKSKYWLVQAVCSHAGILNSPVLLFSNGPKKSGGIYSLAGTSQYGSKLHEDFKSSQSEEALRVRPVVIDDRWLLIAAPAGDAAAIIDLSNPKRQLVIHGMLDVYATAELLISHDQSMLIQLNNDGRFHIYDTKSRRRRISGRWIDDEIVFVSDNGYYTGTYEGAEFLNLRFTGDANIYALSQFESVLRNDKLVKEIVAGKSKDGPKPDLAVPPRVAMRIDETQGRAAAELQIEGERELKKLRLFDDGQLISEIDIGGTRMEYAALFSEKPTGRWITAQAEDETGLLSAAVRTVNPFAQSQGRTLHAVFIGIDKYKEKGLKLNFARSDAERLAGAIENSTSGYYGAVSVAGKLLNEAATSGAILDALKDAVAEARPGDTLLFTFAGHGIRFEGEVDDSEKFYLAPAEYQSDKIAETGLPWAKVTEILAKSKARVVIVLDACHSGATGIEENVASNDEAVSEILKGHSKPVLVLSASKGRQQSFEDSASSNDKRWGGGVFTYALINAMTRDVRATDANGNGVLEISELYGAVKRTVVTETKGYQTPWLVRRDLIGDFALF